MLPGPKDRPNHTSNHMPFVNHSRSIEENYLAALQFILNNGIAKDNRTSDPAITVPSLTLFHDMNCGFPLFTTKKMAKRAMMVELEGFVHGITSKKWYQENKCTIWDEWCNPTFVPKELFNGPKETRVEFQKTIDDLGPVYGYQWRNFGQPYTDGTPVYRKKREQPHYNNAADALARGDQLAYIVMTLKNNPNDRRMVCSAWEPTVQAQCGLPPCHHNFTLIHLAGTLHIEWGQRSADGVLGIPFNISSYALLLLLLCKETGLQPGTLKGHFADCHVYEHHRDAVTEQCARNALPLPGFEFTRWTNLWEWTHKDVEYPGYQHHPPLESDTRVSV